MLQERTVPATVISMLDNQAKHINGVPPKTQIVPGYTALDQLFLECANLETYSLHTQKRNISTAAKYAL